MFLLSSFNKLRGDTSALFSSFLEELLTRDGSSPPTVSSAVLRCFETCLPAKEAAKRMGTELAERLVGTLETQQNAEEVRRGEGRKSKVGQKQYKKTLNFFFVFFMFQISSSARALLCLLPDHCPDVDRARLARASSSRVLDRTLLPPDTKLNLVLCLVYSRFKSEVGERERERVA